MSHLDSHDRPLPLDRKSLVQDLQQQLILPPQSIDTRLKLSSAYQFISVEERRELQVFHSQAQVVLKETIKAERSVPKAFRRRFAHAGDIWSLSPVGFNNAHLLALFQFRSTGGGCSEERWYVLARQAGGWKVQPWDSTRTEVCT